jgi:enoyl-CoA hydratase/carnithine racemase
MSSWPIERKNERVVVVKISSNKANVITHTFMKEFAATLDKLASEFKNDAVVLVRSIFLSMASVNKTFISA